MTKTVRARPWNCNPQGETLVAANLTEDDATVLETLVKRRRRIASDEHAEPLTDDEKREWERILGTAAGDPELFERKRRDAQANAKLDALKDQRKVAGLPRQPLLAEPGSVQLPRFAAYTWLLGDGWTLFADGRFEGEGDHRTLVVRGGIGADRSCGSSFLEAGEHRDEQPDLHEST